jgi:hypothetical protein
MIRAGIGLMALVPMISGPLPQHETALTVALCSGGEISIPLGDGDEDQRRDCHQQACHASTCRHKGKRAPASFGE